MDTELRFKNRIPRGEVSLPASKSISNRVLILNALCDSDKPIKNLSDCDDTKYMLRVLQSDDNRFDIGHAGTAMRFLTAFLSRITGVWEITGSERMRQRPVGILVEALNKLGARIEYVAQPGYPPLRIYGSYLKGGTLEISASVSSQYISALLMVAPYMAEGLTLILTGRIVSRTYIEMTLALMREFGAQAIISGNRIEIRPVPYRPVAFQVESDWSGASYFYELLAIAGEGEILLPGLRSDSIQGDSGQIKLWDKLGIRTRFTQQGAVIEGGGVAAGRLEEDFTEMPDLVQSFAVACCLRNIPFAFSGIETLRIKETNRITALTAELGKLGYKLKTDSEDRLIWQGEHGPVVTPPHIATYNDHRMAMAFASAALKYPGLVILNHDVVSKSFPDFWKQFSKLGL